MKITIDTEQKTAVVHGYASLCEVEDFIKAVFPLGWRLIPITQTGEEAMMDYLNLGWNGEILPPNTVRDLTYKPN
jgi:hypothetical protein